MKKTLKFVAAVFVSFIVYTGLFASLGGYFLRYYEGFNPAAFRPAAEMSQWVPLTLLFNFVSGLFFVAGFLLFRKALPGATAIRKGLFYGAVVPFVGGGAVGMLYNYAFFAVHIAVAVMLAACFVLGGVINGVLTGLIFGYAAAPAPAAAPGPRVP